MSVDITAMNNTIQALGCLYGNGITCAECTYSRRYKSEVCKKHVAKDASDIINQLNAHNKELTERSARYRDIADQLREELNELKAKLNEGAE